MRSEQKELAEGSRKTYGPGAVGRPGSDLYANSCDPCLLDPCPNPPTYLFKAPLVVLVPLVTLLPALPFVSMVPSVPLVPLVLYIPHA